MSLLALAGCTASGVPRFVKFSPDGHRLVYEDACYGRAYTLDLPRGVRHVLRGSVACVDAEITRIVLTRPADEPFWAPSNAHFLVSLQDGAPVESQLPPLPRLPQRHSVFFEFGPAPDEITCVMYRTLYFNSVNTPIAAYRLTLGAAQWTALQPADAVAFGPLSQVRTDGPGGIWNNGHVYCPRLEFVDKGPPKKVPGIDVEEVDSGAKQMYVISSPDGHYVVRVRDVDDPWRRVTLAEQATGRKEIILDKDDAASDVLRAATLPLDIALQPLMWPLVPFME